MGLKQLSHGDRIVFLRLFTKELLINSAESDRLKGLIKSEKIKRKYLREERDSLHKDVGEKFFEVSSIRKPAKKIIDNTRPVSNEVIKSKHVPVQNKVGFRELDNANVMSKITPLIKDMAVQLIECPGPGRNVVVKVRNETKVTRVVLDEGEIEEIVNHFANQAKVPVVGGLLKAAIGDLMVSAVISKYVGSRFIITKSSPYSLIEGK